MALAGPQAWCPVLLIMSASRACARCSAGCSSPKTSGLPESAVLSSLAVLAAVGPLSTARMCGGTSGGGGSWRWRRRGGRPRAAAGAAAWARGDASEPEPASRPRGCRGASAGPAAWRLLPKLLLLLQLPGLLCCQLPRWGGGVVLLMAKACRGEAGGP